MMDRWACRCSLVLGCALLSPACDDEPSKSPRTPATPAASATAPPAASGGSLRGAREVMEAFVADGAEPAALLAALAPKPGDARAVFVDGFAEKAEAHYVEKWAELELAPLPREKELLMWKVTTEQLRRRTGDAEKCPADYAKVAAQLRPGVAWYCFRFVEPADKKGTASEGLVFVNGHWALFPAPWAIQ